MPERVIFPEFRDQYEYTRYPFMDSASMTAQTKQVIDKDIFLDASLYPIGVDKGFVYIQSIEVQARRVTVILADVTKREKARTVFDPLDPPDLLYVYDEYDRPAGVLVSEADRLTRFSSWATGVHTFATTATQFVPSCVIPTPEVGVRGILTEAGDLFTGDFIIVGDNGVVVRKEDDSVIRVDIVGDPLFRRKLCVPIDLFTTPGFVRTINDCPPDQYGNFNLVVGDHFNDETIVRIYKDGNNIVIEAVGTTV